MSALTGSWIRQSLTWLSLEQIMGPYHPDLAAAMILVDVAESAAEIRRLSSWPESPSMTRRCITPGVNDGLYGDQQLPISKRADGSVSC